MKIFLKSSIDTKSKAKAFNAKWCSKIVNKLQEKSNKLLKGNQSDIETKFDKKFGMGIVN